MNDSEPPSGVTSSTASIASSSEDVPEELMEFGEISKGELLILEQDLEEDQPARPEIPQGKNGDKAYSSSLTSLNVNARYGERLSEEGAIQAVPPGDDGLVRHALVIPDKFCSNGRFLVGGLNKRDFDVANGKIKPRRASLPVTQTQLFTSLTKVQGPEGPRWIFNGVLNGWPSLRNFELVELEKKRSLGALTPPDYLNTIRHTWSHYWSVDKEGRAGISPAIKEKGKIYRAKLRGAPWSSVGWSSESPGFMFWFEAQRPEPRVTYGVKAIQDVGEDRCKMVRLLHGGIHCNVSRVDTDRLIFLRYM